MSVIKLKEIDTKGYLEEYQALENQLHWNTFRKDGGLKGKQVGLQYHDDERNIWFDSTDKHRIPERLFNKLNPIFSGTIFESVINEYNLTRSRFMLLAPWSCYSMHRDKTKRLHIPLITNDQSFIIFKDGPAEHLPTGWIYSVDTTKHHTAMNGSNDWRLHFIGCLPE